MSTATTQSQNNPTDLWDNPMGTFGFEFVEYTAEDTAALGRLFEQMGFQAVARHRSKAVTHYRQGEINFIINADTFSVFMKLSALALSYGLPRRPIEPLRPCLASSLR